MALLKLGMNLNVETFHRTSLQGFGYDQKSFSHIKSATPGLFISLDPTLVGVINLKSLHFCKLPKNVNFVLIGS